VVVNTIFQNRISRLEKQQAIKADSVDEYLSDHFRVAVSCPPDTRVHIRGGNVWNGSKWVDVGGGQYIESYTVDFGDADTIDGYTGNFSNADYYIGVIMGRVFGYVPNSHFVTHSGDEFATAAEAEADITDVALLLNPWYGYNYGGGLPLCGVVLKNDGNTGVDGAVLPIDRVNRGRSYYWNDLRPRHYVDFGGPD
jgi:hypothetical protein